MDQVFFFKFRVHIDEDTTEILHVLLRFGSPGPRILGKDQLEKLMITFNIVVRFDDALINAFRVSLAFPDAIRVNRL